MKRFKYLFSPYLIHIYYIMAPEIRFTITEKLDNILKQITDDFGVDKSDYVRSLILNDLRNKNNESRKNRKV